MNDKKFVISYYVAGEIEVEAKNASDAMRNFNDRVGFSNDDLYESLDHDFKIKSVTEKEID